MRKTILALFVGVVLASCGGSATQNGSVSDSVAAFKADTANGTKIDSTTSSVKKDSVKNKK